MSFNESHASFCTVVKILSDWSFFKSFQFSESINAPHFSWTSDIHGNKFRINTNPSSSSWRAITKDFINPNLIRNGDSNMSSDAATGWLIKFLSPGSGDFWEIPLCTQYCLFFKHLCHSQIKHGYFF